MEIKASAASAEDWPVILVPVLLSQSVLSNYNSLRPSKLHYVAVTLAKAMWIMELCHIFTLNTFTLV